MKIAIAQIDMRWTTAENTAAIMGAMDVAATCGAQICAFSELAVTGFHREIAREARPEVVQPALARIQARAGELGVAVAVGAPTFGQWGAKYNSHLLIDERGRLVAEVRKQGLTRTEATFFAEGSQRPVARLHGRRCSAVICREIGDLDDVAFELRARRPELIFVPGALLRAPDLPEGQTPAYVRDIGQLARSMRTHVVQTNWPNSLNRPEDAAAAGGSVVAAPSGEIVLRLPVQASGVGVFTLGARSLAWHPA